MPIPINRNTDTSYGLLGAIKNFISPPGYVSRGPRGSLPGGQALPASSVGPAQSTGMYGRYIPGSQQTSIPTGTSPAAERAYQSEKSRVAQLTAQDPELKRYETERAAAVKSGDQSKMDAARDIGMQIWAAKHGGLAKQVKPGQSGYDAIQGVLNAGQMGAPQDLSAFTGVSSQGLLFNPSSPLASPPVSGPLDYTQVAPSAFGGGVAGLTGGYFGGAANQQQAKMFSRFQQSAPGGTPMPTGMNPALAPGSPYAQAGLFNASYEGATGIQPVGSSLFGAGQEAFASDKAQAQADEFKKRLLSGGGVQ